MDIITVPQPLGDITHYDSLRRGACEWQNNSDVENIVALPHGLMGCKSNDNLYCERFVTLNRGDKVATGMVVDKCCGGVSDRS